MDSRKRNNARPSDDTSRARRRGAREEARGGTATAERGSRAHARLAVAPADPQPAGEPALSRRCAPERRDICEVEPRRRLVAALEANRNLEQRLRVDEEVVEEVDRQEHGVRPERHDPGRGVLAEDCWHRERAHQDRHHPEDRRPVARARGGERPSAAPQGKRRHRPCGRECRKARMDGHFAKWERKAAHARTKGRNGRIFVQIGLGRPK